MSGDILNTRVVLLAQQGGLNNPTGWTLYPDRVDLITIQNLAILVVGPPVGKLVPLYHQGGPNKKPGTRIYTLRWP